MISWAKGMVSRGFKEVGRGELWWIREGMERVGAGWDGELF